MLRVLSLVCVVRALLINDEYAGVFVGGAHDAALQLARTRPEEFVAFARPSARRLGYAHSPSYDYGSDATTLFFIAIPIGPLSSSADDVRASWARWLEEPVYKRQAVLRFFVNEPLEEEQSAEYLSWKREQFSYGDTVFIDTRCTEISGCETHSHHAHDVPFLRLEMHGNIFVRAMMRWAFHSPVSPTNDFRFFVRTDSDAFLCLPALLAQASRWPTRLFVASSFHCAWMVRTDESFIAISDDIARFYVESVGTIIRTFDARATFDDQFGRFLLQTYARLYDDKERIATFPSYAAFSSRGDVYDIPGDLKHFVGRRDVDMSTFVADDVCSRYLVVHPIKQPAVMEALFKASRNQVAPRAQLVGLNCSRVMAPDGNVRPGRVPGFNIGRETSWWADTNNDALTSFEAVY